MNTYTVYNNDVADAAPTKMDRVLGNAKTAAVVGTAVTAWLTSTALLTTGFNALGEEIISWF